MCTFENIKAAIIENPFDYGFFNESLNHKKWMIIGENPGSDLSKDRESIGRASENANELININADSLKRYLLQDRQRELWKCFTQKVKSNEWEDAQFEKYMMEEFLQDFYFTDASKWRSRRKPNEEDIGMLAEEIDAVQPESIFVFGKTAREAIRKIAVNNLVGTNDDRIKTWQRNGGGIKLYFLAHYSPRTRGGLNRDMRELFGNH